MISRSSYLAMSTNISRSGGAPVANREIPNPRFSGCIGFLTKSGLQNLKQSLLLFLLRIRTCLGGLHSWLFPCSSLVQEVVEKRREQGVRTPAFLVESASLQIVFCEIKSNK